MTNFNQPVSDNLSFTDQVLDTVSTVNPYGSSKPSLAKTVILGYNSSGSITSRKLTTQILNADVKKEGERAIDTISIEMPMSVSVKQGNGLYYIQDIVDTRYLRGIWNFQYNILDEAGYDFACTSTNETAANLGTLYLFDSQTFYNTIYRNFGSNGDEIIVTDPSSRSDGLTGQLIDFNGQYDIIGYVRTSSTTNSTKYIFDRFNSGANTGVQFYVSNGVTGVFKLDLNGATQITGSVQINDGKWHFFRIKRDSTGTITLYVDGVVDGTPYASSFSTNYNPVASTNLTIGSNYAVNRIFNGGILQLRFYCGGILTDDDAEIVRTYKPQPDTMKFGGNIVNITDSTDSTVSQAKSWAVPFTQVTIGVTSGSDTPTSYNNVYTTKTPYYIVNDIITKWFPSWTLAWVYDSAGGGEPSLSTYVATGNLLQNMVGLLYTVGSNVVFYSTPRKVFVVEALGIDHTQIVGQPGAIAFTGVQVGGKYTIIDDGKDDSVYVNDITGMGNNDLYHNIETIGNGGLTSFTCAYNPISLKVTVNGVVQTQITSSSPGAGQFYLNFETKVITLGTATSGAVNTAEYDYETISRGIAPYSRSFDANHIAAFGRYSKNITLAGYKDVSNIVTFVQNYLLRYTNNVGGSVPATTPAQPQRVEINAPNLCNHVRINFKVTVQQGVKGINGAYTIKSIEFLYPSGKTNIQLGDFMYDLYDVNAAATATMQQNNQFYTKTKNV